jgi:hypothetical protein
MQYCMAFPCDFMAGSQYDNLTTIRVSNDRFDPSRWTSFLYTSRLASALGIWPWADVFQSSETNNLLLATLSGGPVGVGDPIGREDKANIFKAVRADGVIVKPDSPCVPLDQCYVTDAAKSGEPLLAAAATDHDGLRTSFVFVFNRNRARAGTARFTPGELGCTGRVCLYESASGTATALPSDQSLEITLPPNGTRFYIVAPIGASGAAFLGDSGKFVSTGRQRVSRLKDEPGRLSATVLFARSEKTIELRGYAGVQPAVSVQNGTFDHEKFDPATRLFTLDVSVNPSSAVESESNPVRGARVELTFGAPSGQSPGH